MDENARLTLPYLHRAGFMEAGKRTRTDVFVVAEGEFSVPTFASSDIPVSCVVERHGARPVQTYVRDGRPFRCVDLDSRRGPDDVTGDMLDLPKPSSRLGPPGREWRAPTRFRDARDREGAVRDMTRSSRTRSAPRPVDDDAEERFAEAASAYADYLTVVDGEVLTNDRDAEPCVEVVSDGAVVRVGVTLSPSYSHDSACFSVAREADALAFAEALGARTGRRVVRGPARVRIVDPTLLRFDEAMAAAACVADGVRVSSKANSEGLGLRERFFPHVSGCPRDWPPELREAAGRLASACGPDVVRRDDAWTAEVLGCFGTLFRAMTDGDAKTRRFVAAGIGAGTEAYLRWISVLRDRHPVVAAMIDGVEPPAQEPEEADCLLGMGLAP